MLFENVNLKKLFLAIGGVFVLMFGVLQTITLAAPQFRPTNPPIENTVNWDSTQTEQLWDAACNDCHASDTNWPAYSYIAPVSFLVVDHVKEGRAELNIHTPGENEAGEMIETIREGSMPLQSYTLLHPEANLSQQEKEQLISGLRATFPGDAGEHSTETDDTGGMNETDDDTEFGEDE